MITPNFNPFPELQTERLLLSRLSLSDASEVFRMRSNPEVMRYINRPLPQSIADAEAWISMILAALENNDGITWKLSTKEEPQKLIGTAGLWRIEKENDRAEIGYMIEPAFHGRGLMSEAVKPILDYGFDVLKLHSIEGLIDPRNIGSARVLEKTGFTLEAVLKENYRVRDEYGDTGIYTIWKPGSVLNRNS